MEKLFIAGLLSLVVSCGTEMNGRSAKKGGYVDPTQNCDPTVQKCEPVPVQGQYRAGSLGANASIPASYTFLDTPNANICVDAFIRKGITLPENTVARTLSARSIKSEGIGISDLEPSAVPVLNIVTLDSQCSNMMFQFYNPNAFYCIVKNSASYSNVRIQRSCSAQMTEVEPITHDSVGSSLNLFWIFKAPRDPNATTGAYKSRITELPCVP
jgi:hypothetical protein